MRFRFIFRVGIIAAIIGGGLALLLTVPVLGAIGFSATGVVAGTFAAALQAGIGNVAAGSLFAAAQAATMGGGIPVLFSIIGGVVTGVLGVAAAAFAWAFGSKGAK